MKKKSFNLLMSLLLILSMVCGCSNNASQTSVSTGGNDLSSNSIDLNNGSNEANSKISLDSKLIELYHSSKETQKDNEERGVWGEDDAKFDSEGRLWVKKSEVGDITRETHEMSIDYTYSIYKSEKDYTVYCKHETTNMNTDLIDSTEFNKYEYVDNNFDKIDITSSDFEKIQNEFENMKDYYEKLASGNTLSNKSPSNTKLNKLETVNKSTGDVHYKYGNIIKVLKVIDIGDYKVSYLNKNKDSNYLLYLNDEHKYYFIDLKGNLFKNDQWLKFNIVGVISHELAIVKDKTEKYGLIDKDGRYVVQPKFLDIKFNSYGDFFVVKVESGMYGVIDKNGNYIIKPEYSHIHVQGHKNYYFVVKDEKLMMLDNDLNKIFEYDYYEPKGIKIGNLKWDTFCETNYHDGLLNIYNGEKWGYVDINGNLVIDYKYDLADGFNGYGYSNVVSKDKNGDYRWGLIDKKDNVIIDFQYNNALFFGVDGISRANKDEEGYFINLDNQKVLQGLLFEKVSSFNEGLAFVKNNDKWGIINTNGTEIFPCIFDDLPNYNFSNGISCVIYKNKILLITYDDPVKFGCTYDDVDNAYKELAKVSDDSDFWNNIRANQLDKIEKNNWTEEDYINDLNYTQTYKLIEPDAWYVTGADVWYYFENDRTTTKKGWFVDDRDSQTYYLNPQNGRMAVGWTKIDGEMYYFNESHDNEPNWYELGNGFYESYGKKVKAYGSMFRDEVTPDGKQVDKDGKLTIK